MNKHFHLLKETHKRKISETDRKYCTNQILQFSWLILPEVEEECSDNETKDWGEWFAGVAEVSGAVIFSHVSTGSLDDKHWTRLIKWSFEISAA